MLNKIAGLTLAAGLAFAGSAFAADLPVRTLAPAYAPPVFTWTGFYVGVNAGYTWSDRNLIRTTSVPGACNLAFPGCAVVPNYSVTSAALATFTLPTRQKGFIGGAQIGYNWQFNNFVAGIEADIQGIGSNRSGSTAVTALGNINFPGFPLVQTASVSKSLNYLGTVRARLGFLATPSFLLYATGGFAYGEEKARTTITQNLPAAGASLIPGTSVGSLSRTRYGWTVGGGGEWKFTQNWSVKGEYLYYSLGKARYTSSPLILLGGPGSVAPGTVFSSSTATSSTDFRGHIVRLGLNYAF